MVEELPVSKSLPTTLEGPEPFARLQYLPRLLSHFAPYKSLPALQWSYIFSYLAPTGKLMVLGLSKRSAKS
jgi:hypothetical protein